jgi:hypothetical protein
VRISLVVAPMLSARTAPLLPRVAEDARCECLGIIALDYAACASHVAAVAPKRIGDLAMVLDFLGCTNAAWDRKDLCRAEYEATRDRLERARPWRAHRRFPQPAS